MIAEAILNMILKANSSTIPPQRKWWFTGEAELVEPGEFPGFACNLRESEDAMRIEFEKLADEWERATRNMSNPNAAERHPAYIKIIRLGKPAIPLVLQRLSEFPAFWFSALSAMAGKRNDPVTPSMLGNLQAMSDAWLSWGEKRGHIKTS